MWSRSIVALAACFLGIALTACDSRVREEVTTPKTNGSNPVSSRYSLVSNPSGGTYDITECVKDNGTGLIWEGKPVSGTRAATKTYTNYDRASCEQKWNFGKPINPTRMEVDASTNSIGYVKAVNASALCGFTDWRLPTKDELFGIVDKSQSPTIDNTWLPNTQTRGYWTSSHYAEYSFSVWSVYFYDGGVHYGGRYGYGAVRLVRSGQ